MRNEFKAISSKEDMEEYLKSGADYPPLWTIKGLMDCTPEQLKRFERNEKRRKKQGL